jgi:hypothetical protein
VLKIENTSGEGKKRERESTIHIKERFSLLFSVERESEVGCIGALGLSGFLTL